MLLDAVVAPVTEESPSTKNYARRLLEAWQERDSALLIACEYRDLAETVSAEKREIKYEMEKTVEVVRDFWRNKVVEGGSRAGLMLRASLLRSICEQFDYHDYTWL